MNFEQYKQWIKKMCEDLKIKCEFVPASSTNEVEVKKNHCSHSKDQLRKEEETCSKIINWSKGKKS